MLKAILVRMQKGKRNSLLEDEGILSITGKIVIVAENLASLCSTIVERAEIVNDEIGYVAEEISKHLFSFSLFIFFFFCLVKCRRKEIN